MISYLVGLAGMWLLCDGLISIRLYLNTVDETGKRIQNWKHDHSIRLIRCFIGLFLIIIGGLNALCP
jgi:uncharacterized membrane protein YuzA (DUF378 family)